MSDFPLLGLAIFLNLIVIALVVVQSLSHVWLFVNPWTGIPGFLILTLSPVVCSNSYPLSQWYNPTSVTLLASCPQSFQASGSFPVNQLFESGGQSIVASASTSDPPMNIQGWLPLRLTSLVSLLSKRLWRVFSSTTVQEHQFFCSQSSLWFSSHIHTWLLEKP